MEPCLIHEAFLLHSHGDFFNVIYLLIFKERWGWEEQKEGEKHQHVIASPTFPTGDLAPNPGMCPDWESNQRPFSSQAGTQSTEPHKPGW